MRLLSACILLTTTLLMAQPQILVEEPIHDWGNVKATEVTLEHTFVVKNTGTEPLKITKVKPGCSCTVVDFTKEIAPGKTGTIKSGLKIHKNSPKQSKGITVFSNDPQNPSIRLRLKAQPLHPATLKQTFTQINANVQTKDTIVIFTDMKAFKVTAMSYQERPSRDSTQTVALEKLHFKLATRDMKPDALGFYRFTYVTNFTIETTRRHSGTVTILTNHKDKPKLEKRYFVDLPNTGNEKK